MKATHTRGPWAVVYDGIPTVVAGIGEEQFAIADIFEPMQDGDIDANARLIAAAPELLAALESLTNERIPNRDDFNAAREVIKKARGE